MTLPAALVGREGKCPSCKQRVLVTAIDYAGSGAGVDEVQVPVDMTPATSNQAEVTAESRCHGFYEPSGHISVMALILAPIITIVLSALAGAVYGVVNGINPFIYITCLGTIVVGFVVAGSAQIVCAMLHVRSRGFIRLCSTASAFVAIYTAWVFSVYAYSQFDSDILSAAAINLIAFMKEFARDGIWSIGSITPTGWVLYTIWLIEGGMILFFGIFGVSEEPTPYCESCGNWCDTREKILYLPIDAKRGLSSQLNVGNTFALFEWLAHPISANRYIEMDLNNCSNCQRSNYITLRTVTLEDNGEDDISEEKDVIILNKRVDQAFVDLVFQRIQMGINVPNRLPNDDIA